MRPNHLHLGTFVLLLLAVLLAGCTSDDDSDSKALLGPSKSGVTDLADLEITGATLMPAFSPSVTRFAVDYDSVTYPFSISVTPADSNATLLINDSVVAGGAPFELDTLRQGDKIRIQVIAEDGHRSQKYSVQCLPADFPEITVTVNEDPSPGFIFCADFIFGGPTIDGTGRYLLILDNNGIPVWYKKTLYAGMDFKVQMDSILSYYEITANPRTPEEESEFVTRDTEYQLRRTFETQGYDDTDNHDFLMMENGNVMLMSYYPHDSDLTALGGSPNASVIDLIIQELDPADNVVFEWSSGDHFDITDMTKQHSITAQTIDYVHGNALDTCDDGNIILSCRHMDEVTKINRTTGDIMWRFGGKDARHHDFEIINDPLGGFSHQHCARWLGNNHILLFDNGNYHSPGMSRAVEYELDEENMTATLVWSYEDGSTWTRFMGSVQRLPDGNTVICWGNHNNVITEVRPDGTKAFEISIPSDMYTYRGFRFEWQADEW